MKLAIIPPISYLREFSTDYHLVLAHLYQSSDTYRAFYRERQKKKDFIILDNGAAELGSSISPKDLFYMAIELHPNVLICPDILRDGDKTLEATNSFLDAYAIELSKRKIELLAVPQGKIVEEWYKSFIWFQADPAISWIGISKYVKGAFESRLACLRTIEREMRKKCHLLGMADDVRVIEEEKQFRFVRSTDTAVPIKLGMQELILSQYQEMKKMPDDAYFGTK
jgi:hypothetical protein